jgi:NHL repeat
MTHAPTSLRFEVAPGWEQLPSSWEHADVAGVAVDSHDNVYLICRADHPVVVYDRAGRFLRAWGEGQFTRRTHGITIGPDDMVYCTDDGDHTVSKFTPDGQLVLKLGTSGQPSDTGYDGRTPASIQRAGPPFNRPTNLAVAPSGELYVSDGYGNARVHRYAADGTLIQSWGAPGSQPGEFITPHGIGVAADGRVFVCDRENDRIQIFSPDGEVLDIWEQVQRPCQVFMAMDGSVYVAELPWRAGNVSGRRGPIATPEPGHLAVLDKDGALLARLGDDGDACVAGNFAAPHGLCVDSRGDVYIAEVTGTFAVSPGFVPAGCHTLQKFVRRG